jgi:hypothetical protein
MKACFHDLLHHLALSWSSRSGIRKEESDEPRGIYLAPIVRSETDTKDAFDFWARRFRQRLDEARE